VVVVLRRGIGKSGGCLHDDPAPRRELKFELDFPGIG